MITGVGRKLDPNRRSKIIEDFESSLRHEIVGQDAAVNEVVEIFQMFTAGLTPPFRPVGSLLFLGPTGTGKTRIVEAAADLLFGSERAIIKVDCAEFQHSSDISKLVGSPPGYLGHRETPARFTQEAVNQYHTDKLKLTFVLFDEIEKASDALWQLMLGVLDKGTLTLGDNRCTDMSSCFIFMTSNIGASEMGSLIRGNLGFAAPKPFGVIDPEFDKKIQTTALASAKRKFSPEFMNRIDKSVVFKTLNQGHLEQILELELEAIQRRILRSNNIQFIFGCSEEVKKFLLKEGTNAEYGARYLKRVIERHLVFPLSNLLATHQINIGDLIRVSIDQNNVFVFTVESENSLIPVMLAKFSHMGLNTAKTLSSFEVEPSPAMKRARKKLKEAEDKLAEAKERRKQLNKEEE